MGLIKWLMKKGPGSPGKTAEVVANMYINSKLKEPNKSDAYHLLAIPFLRYALVPLPGNDRRFSSVLLSIKHSISVGSKYGLADLVYDIVRQESDIDGIEGDVMGVILEVLRSKGLPTSVTIGRVYSASEIEELFTEQTFDETDFEMIGGTKPETVRHGHASNLPNTAQTNTQTKSRDLTPEEKDKIWKEARENAEKSSTAQAPLKPPAKAPSSPPTQVAKQPPPVEQHKTKKLWTYNKDTGELHNVPFAITVKPGKYKKVVANVDYPYFELHDGSCVFFYQVRFVDGNQD